MNIVVDPDSELVRGPLWSKRLFFRQNVNGRHHHNRRGSRCRIEPGAYNHAGHHRKQDEGEVPSLPQITTKADHRKSREHSETNRLRIGMTPHHKNKNRRHCPDDHKGVNVILRISGSPIGSLVECSDDQVEPEAHAKSENHLNESRGDQVKAELFPECLVGVGNKCEGVH